MQLMVPPLPRGGAVPLAGGNNCLDRFTLPIQGYSAGKHAAFSELLIDMHTHSM